MYPDWVVFLGWAVVVIWLLGLSFFIFRQGNFLRSLFPKSGNRDIRKKFEEVTLTIENFKGELLKIAEKNKAIEVSGLQHIQKVEILRYNPYDDTGGDQSFTVCLLNNGGSGVVITSLHARNGTRVFGKEIILGKSAKHELSKEEEQVIKKAMYKK